MVSALHYPLHLTLYNHFSKKDTFPSLNPYPFRRFAGYYYMSSATIGSLNVTINGDFNYCMIHCFLKNVSMCYPITFYFYFMWKKINMPRNVNFLWCSNQATGPYTFFGDRLFTCYHLSIHYVLSNQPTLELVMKAENLKGNKIQAVIEYINGTRSKIGRTTQKKRLILTNHDEEREKKPKGTTRK